MRNPRAPAWARPALFAAALIIATTSFTSSVRAEEKFPRLFVFGDSYTDTFLAGLWRVYPLPLQENLGIPQMVEFGVGGARASPFGPPAVVNPPGWHLKQQVDAYISTATPIGPRDLVTINIGGNDAREILGNILTPTDNKTIGYPELSINTQNAKVFADKTTEYATTEIDRLIKAGARNFVLGEFSSLSGLPELEKSPFKSIVGPIADAYAKAYFDGMQGQLVPFAQSGVRFFLFDLARLGKAVNDNPTKYGFSGGFLCPQNELPPIVNGQPNPAVGICGATLANPTINNPLQTQYYFGPDGLHLTSGGFALVAAYMANIVMAPDTIAVQPGIVTTTTSGFTGSVLGRLDAMRDHRDASAFLASSATGGPMGLGYGDGSRARPTGPSSRLTAYTMGTFQGGDRSNSFEQVGFDHDAASGTVGLEYSVNRNLIVGLAGNYTSTNADLNNGAAIDVDALQAAAYISYATRHVYAEALVSYGRHDLDLARPGVIDTIRSSADANAFAAAVKGGYLFDFGSLRAGPIAGLTYIHSRVDGYTEKGDPLLTFNVSAQTLDTLTGNVGVQFRTQFLAGGNLVSPFLNVTLEHQFGDDTHTMTANLVQAPLLPILSPVPSFDTRTYGRIEGGVTFQIGPNVSSTINAASTFARDEGNDYRISTGLNFRF